MSEKANFDVPSPRWLHSHAHIRQTNPRRRKWRLAIGTILLVAVFKFVLISRHYRNALSDKYTSTTYPALSAEDQTRLANDHWRIDKKTPTTDNKYSRERVLANRKDWKPLGSGFEGDAFVYEGVVIKAYRTDNAPFRNCVPGTNDELRWPTEISAGLVLGGTASHLVVPDEAEYVPVVDYFLAPIEDWQNEKWHFVTPFLQNGNLENLSEKVRKSDGELSAHELDKIFRPSFERVLGSLHAMHTEHKLCHDDIKPDNIFLSDQSDTIGGQNVTTHWLLADLGNVREVEHPYHRTAIWMRSNIPDCRSNDVYRLVKSYLKFLRRSVQDEASFNEEFFAGETAWSRFFWSMWEDVQQRQPISAARTSRRSKSLDYKPESPSRPSSFGSWPLELFDPVWWSLMGKERMLSRAVSDKLFIGATEVPARLWGLTPTLRIPVPRC